MTTSEDHQRVRGYLISQANKLSLSELVAKVRADVLPLREVALAVPAARFNDRPAPDEWSAAEVLTHILEMNENGARSIESIIAGGEPVRNIRDEISGATRSALGSAAAYWDVFHARREQLLENVLRANGDEHLDTTIVHHMFGPLNWREWLLFMRVHDLDHLRQLQAITEAVTG